MIIQYGAKTQTKIKALRTEQLDILRIIHQSAIGHNISENQTTEGIRVTMKKITKRGRLHINHTSLSQYNGI